MLILDFCLLFFSLYANPHFLISVSVRNFKCHTLGLICLFSIPHSFIRLFLVFFFYINLEFKQLFSYFLAQSNERLTHISLYFKSKASTNVIPVLTFCPLSCLHTHSHTHKHTASHVSCSQCTEFSLSWERCVCVCVNEWRSDFDCRSQWNQSDQCETSNCINWCGAVDHFKHR